MEIILALPLLILFCFCNYKIVKIDLWEKRIPNKYLKYLLFLLPFVYIYLLYFGHFSYLSLPSFFLETTVTLLIGFSLFYFNIWWAGDAKYLLVLSLFVPHIWILKFIWCIALITIWYLLIYFLWFWLGPNLWDKKRRSSMYKNLYEIKKDQFMFHISKKSYLQILLWFYIFVMIFISLRLVRFFFLAKVLQEQEMSFVELLVSIIQSTTILMLMVFIWIGWLLIYTLRLIYNIIQRNLSHRAYMCFIILLSIVLWGYIIWELIQNPSVILHQLSLILSIYLWLFLIVKILFLLYKTSFQDAEERLIHITQLRAWMIIDKKYLLSMFGGKPRINWVKVKEYIGSFLPHINQTDLKKIQFMYSDLSEEQPKEEQEKTQLKYIKIISSFSFWVYIFLWFLGSLVVYYTDFISLILFY